MSRARARKKGPSRSVLVIGIVSALLNGAGTYVGLFFFWLVLAAEPSELLANPAPIFVYLFFVIAPVLGLWLFRYASNPKSAIAWYGLSLNVAALLMPPAAAIGGGLFTWIDSQIHPTGPITTGASVYFATYAPAVAVLVLAPLLTRTLLWRRNQRTRGDSTGVVWHAFAGLLGALGFAGYTCWLIAKTP